MCGGLQSVVQLSKDNGHVFIPSTRGATNGRHSQRSGLCCAFFSSSHKGHAKKEGGFPGENKIKRDRLFPPLGPLGTGGGPGSLRPANGPSAIGTSGVLTLSAGYETTLAMTDGVPAPWSIP